MRWASCLLFRLAFYGFLNHGIVVLVFDCMFLIEYTYCSNPSFQNFIFTGIVVFDMCLEIVIKVGFEMVVQGGVIENGDSATQKTI